MMMTAIAVAAFIAIFVGAGWLLVDMLGWDGVDINYTMEELHDDCWEGLHLQREEKG